MSIIKVALIDDHKLFRSGIASLMKSFKEYKVIFEASNGEEFCRKVSPALLPEIVLLDLNMPVMDGIQTAGWIRENFPQIKVIILSMHQEAAKVVELVRAGIKGYLLKDSEPDEFKSALDTVAADDIYFPVFVTRYLVGSLNQPEKAKFNTRELEFLKLCASELTYKEIASEMCVALRTVDSYREQLFARLNIKNRIGLVLYALKNKIIEL